MIQYQLLPIKVISIALFWAYLVIHVFDGIGFTLVFLKEGEFKYEKYKNNRIENTKVALIDSVALLTFGSLFWGMASVIIFIFTSEGVEIAFEELFILFLFPFDLLPIEVSILVICAYFLDRILDLEGFAR